MAQIPSFWAYHKEVKRGAWLSIAIATLLVAGGLGLKSALTGPDYLIRDLPAGWTSTPKERMSRAGIDLGFARILSGSQSGLMFSDHLDQSPVFAGVINVPGKPKKVAWSIEGDQFQGITFPTSGPAGKKMTSIPVPYALNRGDEATLTVDGKEMSLALPPHPNPTGKIAFGVVSKELDYEISLAPLMWTKLPSQSTTEFLIDPVGPTYLLEYAIAGLGAHVSYEPFPHASIQAPGRAAKFEINPYSSNAVLGILHEIETEPATLSMGFGPLKANPLFFENGNAVRSDDLHIDRIRGIFVGKTWIGPQPVPPLSSSGPDLSEYRPGDSVPAKIVRFKHKAAFSLMLW